MAYMNMRGQKLAFWRIVLVVLPSFFLFGYNQSNFGGILGFRSLIQRFPSIDTTTTSGETKAHNAKIQGTVVAVYTLGCLVGSLVIQQLGNQLGRRKTLFVCASVATVGLIIQASSYTLAQLVVGRVISGLGNGGVNAIVPVWQSECAKRQSRGKNVVVMGIFIAGGIALAAWVNYGLSASDAAAASWRLPLALPLVFSLSIMACTFLFPESPRWLVTSGRLADAKAVLTILQDEDPAPAVLDAEAEAIATAAANSTTGKRGWASFFRPSPQRLFYRFVLALAIQYCAQASGPNVITYYGTAIFTESLHMPHRQASLLNAGVLTWKIAGTVLAFLTVDRFGRKPLFIAAGAGMGVSMACLAGTVAAIGERAAGIAAAFFLFAYMTFFPLGYIGPNFLYSAEIAPQDLRIYLSGVGSAGHWLFNFVVVEVTPLAFATIGWRYYIVFAVTSFSIVPLVYYFFPETNGRSLEEMDQLFTEPKHFWQIAASARRMKGASVVPRQEGDKPDIEGVCERVEQAVVHEKGRIS